MNQRRHPPAPPNTLAVPQNFRIVTHYRTEFHGHHIISHGIERLAVSSTTARHRLRYSIHRCRVRVSVILGFMSVVVLLWGCRLMIRYICYLQLGWHPAAVVQYIFRAGVHAPTKSVSVQSAISVVLIFHVSLWPRSTTGRHDKVIGTTTDMSAWFRDPLDKYAGTVRRKGAHSSSMWCTLFWCVSGEDRCLLFCSSL